MNLLMSFSDVIEKRGSDDQNDSVQDENEISRKEHRRSKRSAWFFHFLFPDSYIHICITVKDYIWVKYINKKSILTELFFYFIPNLLQELRKSGEKLDLVLQAVLRERCEQHAACYNETFQAWDRRVLLQWRDLPRASLSPGKLSQPRNPQWHWQVSLSSLSPLTISAIRNSSRAARHRMDQSTPELGTRQHGTFPGKMDGQWESDHCLKYRE